MECAESLRGAPDARSAALLRWRPLLGVRGFKSLRLRSKPLITLTIQSGALPTVPGGVSPVLSACVLVVYRDSDQVDRCEPQKVRRDGVSYWPFAQIPSDSGAGLAAWTVRLKETAAEFADGVRDLAIGLVGAAGLDGQRHQVAFGLGELRAEE